MEKVSGIKYLVLAAIIVLALALRFYRLADYPALNADEAAIGYNAYSILETGKDEHGNPWPVHFQSFNDYKPGLYFYLVMPFVKLMGLNELAVRIPGATLGVATVLLLYFLVKELFKNDKLALISAFFLAISPWHIHFSRGGWEVNVATFFITAGVLVFLKSLRNPKLFAFSFLLFALSLYTYHAARVVVPLLGVGLVIIYRNVLKANIRTIIAAAALGLLVLSPLALDLAKGGATSRVAGVGLFADPGPLNRINEERGEHADFQSIFPKLIHNKAVNYGLAFMENWGKHFWGEFLFLSGDDIQRDKVPETGVMYLFDFIFLLVGLGAIAKSPKGWSPVIFWLIIAPVASALTFQSPHALRAENMVIPLTIISAFGLYTLLAAISDMRYEMRIASFVLLIALIGWSFARYEHLYYVHMAKEYPFSSQYGLKELSGYIAQNEGNYKKVIVTTRYDQPYILYLFYAKYPPQKFQKEHALTPRDAFGFSTVANFGKYYFQPIDFDRIKPENPNSLIAGTDSEIPKEANIVQRIYGTNGYLYFKVVAN